MPALFQSRVFGERQHAMQHMKPPVLQVAQPVLSRCMVDRELVGPIQ